MRYLGFGSKPDQKKARQKLFESIKQLPRDEERVKTEASIIESERLPEDEERIKAAISNLESECKEKLTFRQDYIQEQEDLVAGEQKRGINFQKVLQELTKTKIKTPSSDEEYSDFETQNNQRSSASTQITHSSAWKSLSNPSNPDNIIALLTENTVPDNELEQYGTYLSKAISTIASAFSANHAQRKIAKDVIAKRNICQQNKRLAWKLMSILELAKQRNIPVSNASQGMVTYWLAENRTGINELQEAQQKEATQFFGAQTESDVNERLGIQTLRELINRCSHIDKKFFRAAGTRKADNLQKVLEINGRLVEELKNGTLSWNDVLHFITTLKEKEIPLDLDSITALRNAIIDAQDGNDAELREQAEFGLIFDTVTQDLSNTLKTLMNNFTQTEPPRKRERPFIDHAAEFKGFNAEYEEDGEGYIFTP